MQLRPAHAPAFVLVLVLLTWLPTLGAGFVWDDSLLVQQNLLTGSLANLPELLVADLWSTTPKIETATSGYHRPALLLDLAFDRTLFGLSPFWHHLHNLLWHLLAVALLGALARALGAAPVAAAAGMALFGLHPAAAEAVAWVSGRNDLMAGAGLLAALLFLSEYEPKDRNLAIGALAMLWGLWSKESVVLAPALLAGARWARHGELGPRRTWQVVAGCMALWLGLRLVADVGVPSGLKTDQALSLALGAFVTWGHDLVLPVDLSPGRNLTWGLPVPWLSGLLGWVLVGALFAAGGRMGWLGAALAAGTVLPALVGVLRSGEVADRYLYLTLAGMGLALAGLLTAHARVRVRVITTAALCALGAVLVGLTLPQWRDDLSLWRAAATQHPSPYTWGGLGRSLEDAGALDDAAAAYRQATTAPNPFAESCYRVAAVHLKRQDPAAAAQAGRRALTQGCARSPELLGPTAIGLFIIGSFDEAEAMAGSMRSDPTGLSILVRLAAKARKGDLEPLFAAQASGAGDPEQLRGQVAWLLDQAQQPEAAEAIRVAVPSPPDGADEAPPSSAPSRRRAGRR